MRILPRTYPSPPEAPRPVAPTSHEGMIAGELVDLLRLRESIPSLPRLLRLPKRQRQSVLLIPGWRMPEETLRPLWLYLRALGFDAQGWGLGTNHGRPERDRDRLIGKVQEAYARSGTKVVLIGWSLGGVIAREVARILPHQVARIITLATPVVGGPTFTLGAPVWGADECLRLARGIAKLDEDNPIRVPVTAFFTQRDRVVSWPACIDRRSNHVEHVEVRSTHFTIGFDPDVWAHIADTLSNTSRNQSATGLS